MTVWILGTSWLHKPNLKEEELAKGLTATVIATDGIAVIVNKANTLDNIAGNQVKSIYVGDVLSWDEIVEQ